MAEGGPPNVAAISTAYGRGGNPITPVVHFSAKATLNNQRPKLRVPRPTLGTPSRNILKLLEHPPRAK